MSRMCFDLILNFLKKVQYLIKFATTETISTSDWRQNSSVPIKNRQSSSKNDFRFDKI